MLAVTGVKATHDIQKSLRIVITSGMVNQERFSKGLRESLEPRLRAVRFIPCVMILRDQTEAHRSPGSLFAYHSTLLASNRLQLQALDCGLKHMARSP